MLLLSLMPIVVMVVMLGVLKRSMIETVVVSTLTTAMLAIIFWKFPLGSLAMAAMEGTLMGAFPIVMTIVAALFAYDLTVKTGNIEKIKSILMSVSTDKRIQVLLLVWGFGNFLESISGYGTSVAIPLAMLIALGFPPLKATVLCLLSNTVSTAFGGLGIPVITLSKVSGQDVNALTYFASLQLSPLILFIPFLLLMVSENSLKGFRGFGGIALMSGAGFFVPQILIAKFVGPELVAVTGSIVSIVGIIFLARRREKKSERGSGVTLKEGVMAFLPYIVTLILLVIANIPAVNQVLAHVKSVLAVYHGVNMQGPLTIKWLLIPGTIIVIATYIAGAVQGLSIGKISAIFGGTLKKMALSSLAIFLIISISRIMLYSGMLKEIEAALSGMGTSFALVSPVIGALGTFVTGSDTSSGILFGKLQSNVAEAVGLSPAWITAACISGATAGKMVSLQNILIATNAAGIIGSESKVFKATLKYCAGYLLVLALVVFLWK